MEFINQFKIKKLEGKVVKLRSLLAGQGGILEGLVHIFEEEGKMYIVDHLKNQISKIDKELYGK
jgi:hypothetical protein